MSESFPHYPMVPKGTHKNLEFRREMLQFGSRSASNGAILASMCADDALFFFNTFCWTFDPRITECPALPFVTFRFQDDAIATLCDAIGKEDCLIEKSRDMGASWLSLGLFTWRWLFFEMQTFMLVSRNEDYVDKSGDPKSLFWKIDFLLDSRRMPSWLLRGYSQKKHRKRLHIFHPQTRSVIDGESTTGDVARGDRRTAIFMDEYAAFDVDAGYRALNSTQSATDSRIYNSTPQGEGNAFSDQAKNESVLKLRLHWSQHPRKRRGLYTSNEEGVLQILDPDYEFPEGYEFVLMRDGKPRSPWYDRECKRTPIPTLIAQELDIDYLASGGQFFDPQLLDRVLAQSAIPPFLRGDLQFDQDGGSPHFIADPKGSLALWTNPDAHGELPRDRRYTVGADVSHGTGASNSTLSIVDLKTGEKVGEFARSHNIMPQDFARIAVATCRWFNDAYLIWEANGPGRLFGNVVIDELGYRNFYHRRQEDKVVKTRTDIPGWWSTKQTKEPLLGMYQLALARGQFINHSKIAIEECRRYMIQGDGSVAHSDSIAGAKDPTGARDNHGDRVIADALACRALKERPDLETDSQEERVPSGCLAARMYDMGWDCETGGRLMLVQDDWRKVAV